eukprot:4341068-Amphidinium_carterae.1
MVRRGSWNYSFLDPYAAHQASFFTFNSGVCPSSGMAGRLCRSTVLHHAAYTGVHEQKRAPNLNFFRVRPECK